MHTHVCCEYACICMHRNTHVIMHVWKSEDNFLELFLAFHLVEVGSPLMLLLLSSILQGSCVESNQMALRPLLPISL